MSPNEMPMHVISESRSRRLSSPVKKKAVKEKIMKEMFGIIFVTISLARVGYLVRNGFELRYRKWVKGVIMGFWGFVFAAGACLLMGL